MVSVVQPVCDVQAATTPDTATKPADAVPQVYSSRTPPEFVVAAPSTQAAAVVSVVQPVCVVQAVQQVTWPAPGSASPKWPSPALV